MYQLSVWASPHKVSLCHANPLFFDPIYLLIEEVLSLLHGLLELVFLDLPRAGCYGVREGSLYGCGKHICHVQLRVGALGYVCRGGEG